MACYRVFSSLTYVLIVLHVSFHLDFQFFGFVFTIEHNNRCDWYVNVRNFDKKNFRTDPSKVFLKSNIISTIEQLTRSPEFIQLECFFAY